MWYNIFLCAIIYLLIFIIVHENKFAERLQMKCTFNRLIWWCIGHWGKMNVTISTLLQWFDLCLYLSTLFSSPFYFLSVTFVSRSLFLWNVFSSSSRNPTLLILLLTHSSLFSGLFNSLFLCCITRRSQVFEFRFLCAFSLLWNIMHSHTTMCYQLSNLYFQLLKYYFKNMKNIILP